MDELFLQQCKYCSTNLQICPNFINLGYSLNLDCISQFIHLPPFQSHSISCNANPTPSSSYINYIITKYILFYLFISISISNQIMTLRIQVHDGVVAKSTEIIGKMENYVSVRVLDDPRGNGFEARTKIVQGQARSKKSDNRIYFNDVLEVPVSSNNARLQFRIMDQDMTTDDTCAEGLFNVGPCGCLSAQPRTYVIRMQLPAKKNQAPIPGSGGDLRITTQYV